jgi:hypothetical protein
MRGLFSADIALRIIGATPIASNQNGTTVATGEC